MSYTNDYPKNDGKSSYQSYAQFASDYFNGLDTMKKDLDEKMQKVLLSQMSWKINVDHVPSYSNTSNTGLFREQVLNVIKDAIKPGLSNLEEHALLDVLKKIANLPY